MVREYLAARRAESAARKPQLWVRIKPLGSPDALADLAGVMPGSPDGIVLPKTDSGDDIATLAHYLSALEAREGIADGRTRILPVATETARALFNLQSYAGVTP